MTTRRLAGIGAGGGAMAIALLMALSPLASAATHVTKPPYLGSVSSLSSYTSSSGCGSGTLTSPVNWSSTTGVFTWAAKATGKSCGSSLAGVGGQAYGSAEGGLAVAVPIKITTSTTHSIVLNLKLHANTASSFSPGTCTPPVNYSSSSYWVCENFVEWYADVYAYFIDVTNNTYFYPTNYIYMYNESYNYTQFYYGSFYNGSGAFAYGGTPGNESLFWNTTTLNRADSYVMVVNIYASAYVDVYSANAALSGASGNAQFTMAGGPNKGTLASISVS